MWVKKKKRRPLCSFAIIVQFLPHQLSQYPPQFTFNSVPHQVSPLKIFLKKKYLSYQTLDTNICLPISSGKCLPKLLWTQQWHTFVLSTHWPPLPVEQPIVQGLERDWVYSCGLCRCQICHLPAAWPQDILFNLSLPQFPHL